jgi:hypothetical protein
MSATILKKGATAGLTLAEIGRIWCRTDDEGIKPSIFEEIVKSARLRADIMHQDKLYYPLAIAKRKKGLKVKEPISADMEIYEKMKELQNANEEIKGVVEKRQRSNTMIDVTKSPIPIEKFVEENGLAIVKENSVEDERPSPNKNNLLNQDMNSSEAGSSMHGDIFLLPRITRTISIASMHGVSINSINRKKLRSYMRQRKSRTKASDTRIMEVLEILLMILSSSITLTNFWIQR